jgi:hypothetical protein
MREFPSPPAFPRAARQRAKRVVAAYTMQIAHETDDSGSYFRSGVCKWIISGNCPVFPRQSGNDVPRSSVVSPRNPFGMRLAFPG